MFCVSDLAILIAFVMVGRCWIFLPVLNSRGIGKPVHSGYQCKYQKGFCIRPVIKSVALENVLITLFFKCDFLLCNYLAIIIQDTRQGLVLILALWDLRVGRSVLSHVAPRISTQSCCVSWRTSTDTEHLLCVITIESSQPVPAGHFFLHKLLPRKTHPSLTWKTEFSDLHGHFCFNSCFICLWFQPIVRKQISRFYSPVWRRGWNMGERLKETPFSLALIQGSTLFFSIWI